MNLKIGILAASLLLATACSEKPAPAEQNTEIAVVENEVSEVKTAKYIPGEYETSSTGYSGGLKVKVVLTENEISSVEVTSHNEVGKQYYEEAIAKIPPLIVEKQSTDVDVISGATKTSNGIIKAVDKALKKAQGE